MEPLVIRRATPADAATLTEFARRTFVETFADTNTPDDMKAYCEEWYYEARQRQEIEETATLLAELDGVIVGYAQIREATDPAVDGPAPVELVRFYVDRACHGRGIAQQLMTATYAAARALGGRTLWLGVWEHNARAIAFYVKCGFRDVGTHPFILGNDVQTDRVMLRPLND